MDVLKRCRQNRPRYTVYTLKFENAPPKRIKNVPLKHILKNVPLKRILKNVPSKQIQDRRIENVLVKPDLRWKY